MPRGYPQGTLFDGVTSFSGGVNSGLSPLLLEPNQLAFATNCTVRGGFVSPRPPYQQITLDFGGDEDLQAAVEEGLFQGAMVYRPDFGNHLILVSLSGRLFRFILSGLTATISEITPSGDPNPPSVSQVWMWQSENFAIINDGQSLPIIFDGSESRRSYGEQVVLGETAADFTPPAIGETVLLSLADAYTGPFDVPVIINDSFYQTIRNTDSTPTYDVILTNITDSAGDTVPEGSEIFILPKRIGPVSYLSGPTFPFSAFSPTQYFIVVTTTEREFLNIIQPELTTQTLLTQPATIDSFTYRFLEFVELSPTTLRLRVRTFSTEPASKDPALAFPPGSFFELTFNTDPKILVGKTTQDFVVPTQGSDVQIKIDSSYSGPDGQQVWIGDSQYTIAKVPAAAPTNSLQVLNLTDTTSVPVTFPEDILSVPELPPGRMGAYGMGRNWMSLIDGLSFIAGDIVGGDSGSQASGYRDSVLKVTENTFLAEGGVFRLPSSGDFIRAMIFTANMDTSLGQGPLQVFTSRTVFSVNAPVDRTTWQDLENPILTQSLIGSGALAQDATFQVNSDTFFRALDGWRTLILARREFDQQWGNTPITREMERTFVQEDKSLIPFTSGVQFDNRALFSAVPQSTARGIAASAIVALNLDPVSSIRGKLPPVYDGVWTGLNVFKLMRAVIDSTDRSFAFHYNSETQKIELWELLKTREDNRFDNGTDRIEWSFEMASLFVDVPDRPLLRLLDGELQFDNISGELDVVVQYKPDQYPCWTEWTRFTICAKEGSDDEPENKPGFQPRVGLGEPNSADCDEYTGRPFREGHTFQFRIALKGSGRFIGARFAAVPVPDPMFAPPICNGV